MKRHFFAKIDHGKLCASWWCLPTLLKSQHILWISFFYFFFLFFLELLYKVFLSFHLGIQSIFSPHSMRFHAFSYLKKKRYFVLTENRLVDIQYKVLIYYDNKTFTLNV